MSKDNQEQKEILIGLMNSLLSAEEFFWSETNKGLTASETIKAYAKYHTDWHINNLKEVVCDGVGFIETTSEELNIKDYSPFIKGNDDTYWTIDKQSITNAIDKYLKENVKHIK